MELPPYLKRGAALLTALIVGMLLDLWVLRDSPLPLQSLWRVGVQPASATPELAAYHARVAAFERSQHTARETYSASTTDGAVLSEPSDTQTLISASACTEGCTSRGTCNEDTGRCECPVNWLGDTCQQHAAPTCILETTEGAVRTRYVLPCERDLPVPCECKLQCAAYAASTYGAHLDGECLDTSELANHPTEAARAVLERPQTLPQLSVRQHSPSPLPLQSERLRMPVLPLRDCGGGRCSLQGWCTNSSGTARCHCFYGYGGEECEEALPTYCPSGCHTRGVCMRGFCHCHPGSYGMDCALVKDPSRASGSRLFWETEEEREAARPSPAVYVYELPRFVSHGLAWSEGVGGDFGRCLVYAFLDRLLSSAYRVSSPESADYFFVPAVGPRMLRRHDVMRYVRDTWPYWNASTAPRHVWLGADDAGASAYFSGGDGGVPPWEFTERSVFLQHLGLHLGSHRGNPGSFAVGRDINIAPEGVAAFVPRNPGDTGTVVTASWDEVKPLTFFFSGIISHDDSLPHNVRRRVAEAHAHRPGYSVSGESITPAEYQRRMASSLFCLAPSGHGGGWGIRVGNAVVVGCIPVIVQDNVTEVYEELLPYDKFSVRLAEADIPRMHDTLSALADDADAIRAMRRELFCARKYFLWSSVFGRYGDERGDADAFAAVIAILRRRLAGQSQPWHSACDDDGHEPSAPAVTVECARGECQEEEAHRAAAMAAHAAVAHGTDAWPFLGGAACAASHWTPPC